MVLCIDLFGGCGGAALGLRAAGLEPWSYERDADCVGTLRAAGHRAVRCDLGAMVWDPGWAGEVSVLHGSPPCQPWSANGLGRGGADERDGMPHLLRAVEVLRPSLVTVENVQGLTYRRHVAYLDAFVAQLGSLGYAVEWRVLNAADYGVPQTRKRLLVVGRRSGPVRWPRASHERARWVSMASALGWDAPATLHTNTDQRDGRRQTRSAALPTPTITAKSGGQWVLHRPATTVSGDTRVHPPGHRANRMAPGHKRAGPDAYRLSVAELAVLQDLPADYPFVGTKTSAVKQIGNALPPRLLEAVVGANLDPPRWPVA